VALYLLFCYLSSFVFKLSTSAAVAALPVYRLCTVIFGSHCTFLLSSVEKFPHHEEVAQCLMAQLYVYPSA
jgi:hypothetical protein